jgi:hypothetical protein
VNTGREGVKFFKRSWTDGAGLPHVVSISPLIIISWIFYVLLCQE